MKHCGQKSNPSSTRELLRNFPQVREGGGGFYSHYFLAPRKVCDFRLLNLKGLNACLLVEKFRMETLASIVPDLQLVMWMVSLDLKDANLHVLICLSHRHFLIFKLRDALGLLHIYQWRVLSFVVAMAPRLHKVPEPSRGTFPSMGYIYVPVHRRYLQWPRFRGLGHLDQRCKHLSSSSAGICHQPSQVFPCSLPGDDILLCTYRHSFRCHQAHPGQVQEISQVSQGLLADGYVSMGHLQRVVSLMAACHATVLVCLFQVRPISSHLSRKLKWNSNSLSKLIPLDFLEVLKAPPFRADPLQVGEGVPGIVPRSSSLNWLAWEITQWCLDCPFLCKESTFL